MKKLEKLAEELEGKYFAFSYTNHDINYEGTCLAILKLKRGCFVGIMGYDRYAEEMEANPEITQRIIDEMKRRKIRTVHTFIPPGNKLWGWEFYHENPERRDKNGVIDEWAEYTLLGDYEEALNTNGITVEYIQLA